MPSYKEYQLVCQHCGKTFIGYRPWTRYCSHTCSSRAIKQNKKIMRLAEDSAEVKEKTRQLLVGQEYISITHAAQLLDVSRPTLYKILRDNKIEPVRLGPRTVRVRVADLVDNRNTYSPLNTPFPQIQRIRSGYVTMAEATKLFNMDRNSIYLHISKSDIKSVMFKGQACYNQKELEAIILPHQCEEADAWYTVEEISQKFKISVRRVYDVVNKRRLRKKRSGHKILIARYDWDMTRKPKEFNNTDFYTMKQILAKYGETRDLVDNIVRARKITNFVKDGVRVYDKEGIDTYFNQRKTSRV